MKINKKLLEEAVEKKIITGDQARKLLIFLKAHPEVKAGFNFGNVLYYMGGLVAIGAMTLFMNLGWEFFGGWGIFFISLVYASAGLYLASTFRDRGYPVPSAICAAFVIALTPLAIYGLQKGTGWWPDDSVYRDYHHYVRWHWIYMELGTLAVGAITARVYRHPFLLMPVAATLWYLSMDTASVLAEAKPDLRFRAMVSMWFGLANILMALWVDIRSRRSGDYAFWLYMSGVTAFWGGVMSYFSNNELSRMFAMCINLGLAAAGVVLMRRVFVVFGALGCTFYLGHLAYKVFRDSILFPFALTAIGLIIIYLGLLWQKNESSITGRFRRHIPRALAELLDKHDY